MMAIAKDSGIRIKTVQVAAFCAVINRQMGNGDLSFSATESPVMYFEDETSLSVTMTCPDRFV